MTPATPPKCRTASPSQRSSATSPQPKQYSPILIFQNEKGGRSKPIDMVGIKQRYDNVKELYAGNLEKADAADDVRDSIEFFASHLSHIGEELPVRWITVRADIEARASEKPYIPM